MLRPESIRSKCFVSRKPRTEIPELAGLEPADAGVVGVAVSLSAPCRDAACHVPLNLQRETAVTVAQAPVRCLVGHADPHIVGDDARE
jgi:hypothetical protein